MLRAGLALAALSALVLGTAQAADPPPVLDRAAIDALRTALRASGVALGDLAAADRSRGPLPLASEWTARPLAEPLAAPDLANRLASAVATDVGARGSAGNDGMFGVVAGQWGVEPALTDVCAPAGSGGGLAAQHIAASEARGGRWSKRQITDLQARLHPEIDRLLGALADDAAVAACRVEGALTRLDPAARSEALADALGLLTLAAQPTIEQGEAAARLTAAWAAIDRAALLGAATEWTESVDAAALALSGLDPSAWPTAPVIWRIGLGEVWIGSPASNSGTGDPVLLVDPGGDDHWRIRPDAKRPAPAPVRGWIDLGGDDVWRSGAGGPGSATLGISAGVDATGDDVHAGGSFSAGAAVLGISTWLDAAGDDLYEGSRATQGFGILGAGLLRDTGRGADTYTARGLAQGVGLPGGVGVLHDDGGPDRYLVRDPAEDLCAGGCAQGAGLGLRPWLSGGIGALIDDGGDDRYDGGERVQAAGLWGGLGILRDGGGHDQYGARAHAIAWAGDTSTAVLLDASGDDRYVADDGALGAADDRGIAWLIDSDGSDLYAAGLGIAWAGWRADAVAFVIDGDQTARWVGGQPLLPSGHPDAITAHPAITAVTGRTPPPSPFGRGGLGSSPTTTVRAVQALLPTLAWPLTDPLDSAGDSVGSLIRRRTPPEQLTALARSIADDALARGADDPTAAWHLEWLGALARATPLASAELARAADSLQDHSSALVRVAVWDARATLGAVPDLVLPPEDIAALATASAVALQREESLEVRAAAARAAGVFGAAGVASSLTDALLTEHLGLRRSAEAALLALCTRTDGVAVARGLYGHAAGETSADPVVRDAALRVLGATHQRDAVVVLSELLADVDPAVALNAAIGLARDGGREATKALIAWRSVAPQHALESLDAVVSAPE